MEIIIPESIADITILQNKKYENLISNEDISDHEKSKRAINIFTGIPYHKIDNIALNDYEDIVNTLISALKQTAPFKSRFTLDGIDYGFIPNFDKLTQGEFLDLSEYEKDPNDINKMMAVLFRPIIKQDKKGNYKIESYKGTGERAKIFESLTMDYVNGALSFFLTLSKDLNKAIQKYTEQEQMKAVKHLITS